MNVDKEIDWAISHVVKDRMRLKGFGQLTEEDLNLVAATAEYLKSMIDPGAYVVIRDGKVDQVSDGVEEIDMDAVPEMGPDEAFELYIRLQDLGLDIEAQEVREEFGYEWSEWND